ncbi:hypothetical protein E2C01_043524 [Portunus trituberculatus]|uniref:Uncharacterized protein n=1 Tax=Portunus trituberculatus TaxID=210409 RepID=A0A5B7FXJ8_PORTR|nr:hypothetical protein [Portunus trituberculatus]
MEFFGLGGVSVCAAPHPNLALGVRGVQLPAVSGSSADFSDFGGTSREFSGLGGMSLRAAPLPAVAPGLSGLQAPADPVSSMPGPGLLPSQSLPLALLVEEKWDFMQHHSLGDGNFAGSASLSSMGLPHVDLLHGSMSSQVPPWPVDAGADPGGAVVS